MRKIPNPTSRHHATIALLASTMLCVPAFAQDTPVTPTAEPAPSAPTAPAPAPSADEQEIVVTATKRRENLQDVPIAITALGTKTLDDLQVDSFDDYAKAVPSLSYKSAGPGSSNVYFRGVASGENSNHSASLPSVGTYLDEQPITTITGALDLHIFDIARVEALAGPQGTLYGASSQAGTVRIITNKPDLSHFYGAANVEVNSVAHGDIGYTGEAFVNAPITNNMAVRVVGWYRRDAGYIDNIRGVLNYPEYIYGEDGPEPTGNIIERNNYDVAEDNYNDVSTLGARAALKIDLNENWTITPQIMAQKQVSHGSFAEESGLGKLETMQFSPEKVTDKFWQAALTVEGKVGNFDITYAGAYMKRQIDGQFDYSDYSYFYDAIAGYGAYWYDNDYNPIDPTQYVRSDDSFNKMSHELRITSPADRRLRLVAGVFFQRQEHNIEQHYIIDNIADFLEVDGQVDNIWLTKQIRVDRDYAAFGEVSFDIVPKVTLTAGGRWYKFDNTLVGWFGFNNFTDDGNGYSSNPDYLCDGPAKVSGSPCTNVDKRTKDTGFVHRLNASWKPNKDMLLYATWSRGFRPGGINRRGSLPPYKPDFLVNYEAGMKYSFGSGSHLNVAVYQEDWSDIQLSFLGANGLTEVRNAGNAQIRGVEADLFLRPMEGLAWSTGVAFNDAKLIKDFCYISAPDCIDDNGFNLGGAKGTRLPLTARLKANSRIRYEWFATDKLKAHVQAAVTYEGARTRDVRKAVQDIYGKMDAYTLVDLSAGADKGGWSAALFVKNLLDTRGQISKGIGCNEFVCGDVMGQTSIGPKIYTTVTRPRTIGLRIGRKF